MTASLRKEVYDTVDLTWHDVCCHVLPGKGSKPVQILDGCSGHARSGHITSIMGPSGAGKTTMMDLLAGRLKNVAKTNVSGAVLVNERPVDYARFWRASAYVQQEDYLPPTETVYECLMFNAQLRLPRKVSREDRRRRVDTVLAQLGLQNCAHTLVGSAAIGIKGISGGEKRRASIGVELVTSPSCIFLDEPTSGLDSEIAVSIMRTLRDLATSGRTVALTIHQPNSDISELFDDFFLMAKGRIMYGGPWSKAVQTFAAAGFPCPRYKNPTDYFIKVASNEDSVDVMVDLQTKRYAANKPLAAHAIMAPPPLPHARTVIVPTPLPRDASRMTVREQPSSDTELSDIIVESPVAEANEGSRLLHSNQAKPEAPQSRKNLNPLFMGSPADSESDDDDFSPYKTALDRTLHSRPLSEHIGPARPDSRSDNGDGAFLLAPLPNRVNLSQLYEPEESAWTLRQDDDDDAGTPMERITASATASEATSGSLSLSRNAALSAVPNSSAVSGKPAGLLRQLFVLSQRQFRAWRRHPIMLIGEAVQYIFLAFFIGGLYFKASGGVEKGVFDRAAAVYLILVCVSFTPPFTAITVWQDERKLIRREVNQNVYSLDMYFWAKTFTMMPFELFFVSLVSVITYFMFGFQHVPEKFFIYFATMVLAQLISESLGLLCAMVCPTADLAIVALTIPYVLFLALTGLLVTDTPVYYRWVEHINFLRYGTAITFENEMRGLELTGTDDYGQKQLFAGWPLAQQTNNLTDLSMAGNFAVLGGMLVIVRITALLALKMAYRLRWL